jgi:oligoendopeptidase F
MEQLGTEVSNTMLFFELWWKGIDDPDAQRLLSASGDNAYYLEAVRRFMPHTRSEAEEKAINLKNVNGVNALVNLYDMITNRFSFEFEVDDQGRQASTWHRPSSGREVLKCCAAWSTTWQFCDVVAPLEPLASSNQ